MKRDILSLSQVLPLKAQNLLVSEKAKCARQGTYMHYPGSTLKSVPLCLLFKPALLWEIAFLLFVGNLCDCYSQVVPVVKKPPANARDARDAGSIPGSERSPGEGNGNPLQYSCLENSVDRGARWATVHGVAKIWTRLSD